MIGQEVSLIVLDKYVIGYINNSNNDYYYYLTKEFAQTLKLGIHWRWIVLVEILLALGLFFNSAYAQSYIAYSIFAIPILYVAGMRFFNFYIEKKIDEVVLNG